MSNSTETSENENISSVIQSEISVEKLTPLQTQVAGHQSFDGKSNYGMLHHPGGYVLKPVKKIALLESEIKFYEYVNATSDPVTLDLKEFVPKFYGSKTISIDGKDVRFIALQNVTDGMCEPCVMDVKIGKQTWEPNAPEEKRNIEKAKYVECRRECGFCIPGLQYYGLADHQLKRYGKDYGKKLDNNGIIDALKGFLNWDPQKSSIIILQFLCKLWKILQWFQNQRTYSFYSSSLLFVYDSQLLRSISPVNTSFNDPCKCTSESSLEPSESEKLSKKFKEYITHYYNFKNELDVLKKSDNFKKALSCEKDLCLKTLANVKMIDFAHVIISKGNELDSNYLEGLKNLIDIFDMLLEENNKRAGISY